MGGLGKTILSIVLGGGAASTATGLILHNNGYLGGNFDSYEPKVSSGIKISPEKGKDVVFRVGINNQAPIDLECKSFNTDQYLMLGLEVNTKTSEGRNMSDFNLECSPNHGRDETFVYFSDFDGNQVGLIGFECLFKGSVEETNYPDKKIYKYECSGGNSAFKWELKPKQGNSEPYIAAVKSK
ncbi:hypothetical protein MHLP_03930 [Candidatus Mycoplasma haematolamae str. Purdue]|uniref:Uncharacterized protein n=1 Tax=Mycoplasma haematolamae (strain Purdue) TaxID=1212765 RepID=I7CGH1_MYCHA|nr:hypothetical protein [Candidatus Mycoplasma haematolamae]AFO52366.1 hypothetical protein MHLP_03930 [Candidatus Mycoplasma haematolamae str. Purdue]